MIFTKNTGDNARNVYYRSNLLGLGILLGSIDEEVADALRITPLVIVPADELDKVRVQADSCTSIEDRGVGFTNEVRRDHMILSVTDNSLRRAE